MSIKAAAAKSLVPIASRGVTAELPNLHDAVLRPVTIDWTARTASIHCERVPGGPVILVAGDQEIRLDRREPWGPSDFINSVYVDESSGAEVALYIEMQTGDQIFVLGSSLDVEEPSR